MSSKSLSLVVNDQRTTQRSFSCAEVQSRGFHGYGTYEVRMRSAAAGGVLSAFFIYAPASNGKSHEQISIEFVGRDPGTVLVNYNVGAGNRARSIALDFDGSKSVNSYAFQWTPEAIRWFVNGRLVHEVKAVSGEALPSRPGKIVMTSWKGTDADQQAWLGPFEYAGRPIVATIEHVAFTPLDSPCQFPTSVVCSSQSANSR